MALLGLSIWASAAVALDRRDIVFDCPCSAEWVAGADGGLGTLTLAGGVRSARATGSGELRISVGPSVGDAAFVQRWDRLDGVSAGRLRERAGRRAEWAVPFRKPAPGDVIELHLLEQTARGADGIPRWHRHEALAMWPVPSDGGNDDPARMRFVDILTDSDGDGVGDVNERLAATSPADAMSAPGETVIDVLALYSAAYAASESGYPYTPILHAVSASSALFEDSRTNLRLRLVGMSEVELDAVGNVPSAVWQARMDSHGADLSVQFGPGPCRGPCANLGAAFSSRWRGARAFLPNPRGVVVAAHELGHTMGLAHSARQGEAFGAWRWSRGHVVSPRGRPHAVTIMGYGQRLLGGVFSDPDADCGIGPCGVAAHELDGADAVATLDALRFQVGAWRAPAADSDGDGIVDAADAAPNDADDWFDIDGDGVADNADPDDDNDGVPDIDDAFPVDSAEWADADGDGRGDNADQDVQDLSPFRDPGLRTAVEYALGKDPGAPISAEELASLSELQAPWRDIKDLTGLEHATGLVHLRLGNNRIADLRPLAGLAGLEVLELPTNAIIDLEPLAALTGLRELSLFGNPIEDISPLAELPAMQRLNVGGTRLSAADVLALPYVAQLLGLGIGGLGLSDVAPLSGLTRLDALDLSDNRIADVAPLAGLSLRDLSLKGNRVADLTPLQDMAAMRKLDLGDNGIADIAPLAKMVGMWELKLGGNRIVDIGPLADMAAVYELTLNDNGVADLSALAAMTGMRDLDLSNNAIADIAPLANMTGMWDLNLDGNRIADVSALAAMTDIVFLQLRDNAVSDIAPLADLLALTGLHVARNRIGQGDWIALGGSPLNETALNTHVATLIGRGVDVSVGTVALSAAVGAARVRFDVSGYFEARLGAGAAMTASSDDLSLATPEMDRGTLVVTPGARAGTAAVTVTAAAGGRTETLVFTVRIRGPWLVPLVPNASGFRQGFVRIVNRDPRAGEVRILPVDDAGRDGGPLTLAIDADQVVHFNSADLEAGNAGKGLIGAAGRGSGDWRLTVRSGLDLEVLAYSRTPDGFLTSLHDVAPRTGAGYRVPTFNPASNMDQASILRLGNPGPDAADVTIAGVDDDGKTPGTDVRMQIPAGGTRMLTAGDLEAGGVGLTGALGDGRGKWRLLVRSSVDLSVMNLLSSPEGHLTNLTTVAPAALYEDGTHTVPLFPSASNEQGLQGFVRVVNRSTAAGTVRIYPYDDNGRAYDAVSLDLGARRTQHFNSDDLELGNPAKGIAGATGPGTGGWQLEVSSELDIEVLAYLRTPSGFLTSMHDVVARSGRRYDVAMFNPGSNVKQSSRLRIVNRGAGAAHLAVSGIDDSGNSPGQVVRMSIPARAAVTVTAAQFEDGDFAFHDQERNGLRDGRGKWRLQVDSEQDVVLMNLLASPTGHLTNLSTSPNR